MGRKNYSVEQIIVKLREIEILCNQGMSLVEAVRKAEITTNTYYRWRREYGGMSTTDAKKVKALEKENQVYSINVNKRNTARKADLYKSLILRYFFLFKNKRAEKLYYPTAPCSRLG